MQSRDNKYVNKTLQVKCRDKLIVKLKVIKFKKDIFYYLFFYLHYSFF